ncbi:hypothetical protein ZIOFF_038041 [Zingiber officinale]|uniref:Transcription factor CBF/NF-Y/archaeal histone domain-containing protein n=1 Tax=Zingiber officinale TaxID=94328 RepID=A0A8J5L9P3_ZINOF|nr:hypothetical protein ZIOFF_038041 [Zingiber officinale]
MRGGRDEERGGLQSQLAEAVGSITVDEGEFGAAVGGALSMFPVDEADLDLFWFLSEAVVIGVGGGEAGVGDNTSIKAFAYSRIKKIMQADEDVGKIAMAVPLLVSKALELFLQDLCDRTYEITLQRGAKTLNSSHL